jgi:hypothetical protein
VSYAQQTFATGLARAVRQQARGSMFDPSPQHLFFLLVAGLCMVMFVLAHCHVIFVGAVRLCSILHVVHDFFLSRADCFPS